MAADAPAGPREMAVTRAHWLALAAAGFLMALPLGPVSFVLLLFVPGLAACAVMRRRYSIAELVAMSFVLSLVLFALATLATVAFGLHVVPQVLSLLAIVAALYRYRRSERVALTTEGWLAIAIAIAIAVAVFVILYGNTFAFRDGALYVQPTHACDAVFHLSIVERYVAAPQVPPQEPFLPGYEVVYNWLGFAAIGELVLATGVELFLAYKAIVALVAGLIFLTAYLLAAAAFNGKPKASLLAALVFVGGAGLSWAYILYQQLTGATPDVFYDLVYSWPGVMTLKYDPVSLFFFLPQPQTFALLLILAGLYTYHVACRDRSPGFAVASGLTLAALILFHLMSAFATLIPAGLYGLYVLFRQREAILGGKDLGRVGLVALPLAMCLVAGLFQLSLLTEDAASHVQLGHHPDVFSTMAVTVGLLIPFALYGAWRVWRHGDGNNDGAVLLIVFGLANFAFINVLELPRSMDTYRFLDFLTIPLAIFAGYAFWELLSARALWKKALAVAAILLIVPSSLVLAAYYTSPAYQQAPADDVAALAWMKANTPVNAVVFENPSPFPRVSLLSGRVVSYTGQYMDQFHGVNLQWPMEQIMRTTDPAQLRSALASYGVSYVFLGSQERGSLFAGPLQNSTYFRLVYGDPGGQSTKIYLVI